jgi:seryl-tRNA synthetase
MNKTLNRKLREAGLISDPQGNALLSGAAENLYQRLIRYLISAFADFNDSILLAPVLIQHASLRQSGYTEHFPHQLFSAANSGKPNSEFSLTPAACLHLYPMLQGKRIVRNPFRAFVLASCARFENGNWEFPFRLPSFHMAELVAVGGRQMVERLREALQHRIASIFHHFKVHGTFKDATDSFFLPQESGARILQKLKGLKKEFVVAVGRQQIALASINDHEDYFGKRFGIRLDRNHFAFSCCAAFGLERVIMFLLWKFGSNEKNWPRQLRS